MLPYPMYPLDDSVSMVLVTVALFQRCESLLTPTLLRRISLSHSGTLRKDLVNVGIEFLVGFVGRVKS